MWSRVECRLSQVVQDRTSSSSTVSTATSPSTSTLAEIASMRSSGWRPSSSRGIMGSTHENLMRSAVLLWSTKRPLLRHGALDGKLRLDGHHARLAAERRSLGGWIRYFGSQRSSGVRPVRVAMRANILGPSSSSSWKANTKSSQPARLSVRCEPDCRFSCQPIFRSAASTRRAFVDGQLLKRPET